MLFFTFVLAFASLVIAAVKGSGSAEEVTSLRLRIEALERNMREGLVPSSDPRPQAADAADAADATKAPAAAPESAASASRPGTVFPPVSASELRAAERLQERRATAQKSTVLASAEHRAVTQTASAPTAPVSAAVDATAAQPSAVAELADSLLRVFRRNPFASVGVIMFMIGLGFLFSLLAAHNILTPTARVVLVALAGVAVFVTGLRQEKTRLALGWNLEGGALAIEYLCVLWGFSEYHLMTPETAFVLLGGLSTLAYGFAALKKGLAFAFMGMAGGLITPIVTSTGQGQYAALVLYSAFVAGLSLATGRFLRSISLPAVTYLAVTALLGSALDTTSGSHALIIAGCSVMSLSFLWAGLTRCFKQQIERGFDVAAGLLLILLPAVSFSALLGLATAMSVSQRAWLPALTGGITLMAAVRADLVWRARLVVCSAILALVALTMRFHGAEHAAALAATSLTLILAGRAMNSKVIDGFGWLYWMLSVAEAASMLSNGAPFSMYCAALVATVAGCISHGRALGRFYCVAAPLLTAAAVLDRFGESATHFTIFMLGWASLSALLSQSRWPDFKWGSVWLLPAGVALLLGAEWTDSLSLWIGRDVLLTAWLGAATLWVFKTIGAKTIVRQPAGHSGSLQHNLLFLAWPVAVTIEVTRIFLDLRVSDVDGLAAATALNWAIAGLLRQRAYAPGRAVVVEICLGVSALMAVMSMLMTHFSPIHELTLMLAIGILMLQVRARVEPVLFRPSALAHWLAAGAASGAVLQLLGLWHGLDQPVLELLVQSRMQPYVSGLWATSGIAIVVTGSRLAARDFWFAGSAVLALLIAKMFGVDLVALTLAEKVGTFMAVGLGLIALGYFCPLPPKEVQEKAQVIA
jgi:uncharacterized membrane protein